MPITTDVRKYGETVLEQGKVVLEEARKPWYAAVGAGELAYGQLTQLPAEVQARLRKLQTGAGLDPAHARAAVQTATGKALGAYGAYAGQARETYETLAERGETVVRRLRRSPEIKSAFDRVEEVVLEAGEAVVAAEDKVTRPGPRQTRTPGAAGTPADMPATSPAKARAARTRTAKVPAAKAPAAKVPAAKAATAEAQDGSAARS